jgi:DNA-directed RNA polymerase specialized sigma24 family protein
VPDADAAADLQRLLAERGEQLMCTAVLLTGSHQDGEDLLQAGPDLTAAVDLRDALMRILRMLPPQQRAVIVLRYWEQLTQAETAAVLGCSEGTVKSAASRGLGRMRDLARPWMANQTDLRERT